MLGFLSNPIRVYPGKLKIGMLYYTNNTFQNTVLWISVNVPLKLKTKKLKKKKKFTCFFHEIKTNIFTCFYNMNVKIPYEQSFFSQFHEQIFRSSRLQMFFKIGALKDFEIFWIKKRLQQRCFSVNFNLLIF